MTIRTDEPVVTPAYTQAINGVSVLTDIEKLNVVLYISDSLTNSIEKNKLHDAALRIKLLLLELEESE